MRGGEVTGRNCCGPEDRFTEKNNIRAMSKTSTTDISGADRMKYNTHSIIRIVHIQ